MVGLGDVQTLLPFRDVLAIVDLVRFLPRDLTSSTTSSSSVTDSSPETGGRKGVLDSNLSYGFIVFANIRRIKDYFKKT